MQPVPPALSVTHFTILYHVAETDFCSPVELQHAPLLLLCWLRTHRNRFLCPSPLWRCSTTVNSWIISGPNIQRDDIITSWSTHSCLHLSFFLQPNRKFTVSGISSTELSMTRTKSRRQPLTQLWRAPTPFSALPNQLAIAEKMTLLVLSWISVCILLLCKRFKYRFI